jgi:YggT family protein
MNFFKCQIKSWRSQVNYGKPYEVLRRMTDPYLDWFRRFPLLRSGMLDFSPIAALALLSLFNSVFGTLGRYGRISLGIILSILLSSLWAVCSFILGFFIVVLILRLIAFLTNRNIYGAFWRIVDIFSQPLLYRMNRIIFRNRPVQYLTGIITALLVLLALMIIGGQLIALGAAFLRRLPF